MVLHGYNSYVCCMHSCTPIFQSGETKSALHLILWHINNIQFSTTPISSFLKFYLPFCWITIGTSRIFESATKGLCNKYTEIVLNSVLFASLEYCFWKYCTFLHMHNSARSVYSTVCVSVFNHDIVYVLDHIPTIHWWIKWTHIDLYEQQ